MLVKGGDGRKGVQLLKGDLFLCNIGAEQSALRSSHQYIPYRCPASGTIRFGYRDPSVRPSIAEARKARGVGAASGIFASKSAQTPATISLQCCKFVRAVLGRRASKTPNAFFQDSYAGFTVSGVGPAVKRRYTPGATGRGGCIPPYTYPGTVRPTVPGSNRRGCQALPEERAPHY